MVLYNLFFYFLFFPDAEKNLHIKILAQIMPVCTIAPPDKEMNDNALIKNVFFKIIALWIFDMKQFLLFLLKRKKSIFSHCAMQKCVYSRGSRYNSRLQPDNISQLPFFAVLWDRSDSFWVLCFLTGLQDLGIQQSIAPGQEFDGMNTNVAEQYWHMSDPLYRSRW